MTDESLPQLLQSAMQRQRDGNLHEAETLYNQVLAEHPEHPDALNLLGVLMCQTWRPEKAVELISKAIELKDDQAEYHCNLGIALTCLGRDADATAAYDRAIQLKPTLPSDYVKVGNALRAEEQFEQAIEAFRLALALKPDDVAAHHYLGLALLANNETDEAVAAMRRALALNPESADLQYSLGFVLDRAGLLEEARRCYLKALAAEPTMIPARLSYAVLLMAEGESGAAWKEFAFASELQDPLKKYYPHQLWDGGNPKGKTILVYATGPFGEMIWQARAIPLLKQHGAKILLQCPEEVRDLFQTLGCDATIPLAHTPPKFDAYVPLAMLPDRVGISLDEIPESVPYLRAPDDRRKRWAGKIPQDGKLNIGLVWAAGGGDLRSQSLEIFAPLAKVPNTRFVSMQKGPASSQKPPPEMNWLDPTAEITDFADTAAIIEQLNLIISVDTSVAHLAGAMGMPVWTLLPSHANLLWMLHQQDSPWYPTMRLFRQQGNQGWAEPVDDMFQELRMLTHRR
jgi:Flp pilus assembly protein TadD